MAATAITAVTRFFPTGTTQWIYAPAVANKSAPTRSEINAGTNLSGEVAEVSGWQLVSELIDTPDISTTFTGKIAGRTTADDSTITFYASATGADVRTLLPRGTAGFILRMDGGDTAGRKMDVFPVLVTAAPKDMGTDDKAATIQVMFAITSVPVENVSIPA